MTYTDLMFLPAQSAVLGCLSDAAALLSDPPAVVVPRYGSEVVFDLAQDADLCCSGFAWVRMVQAVPEFGVQPAQCGPLAWGLDLEVGMVTYAPMGDDEQVVSEVQHAAANATMAEIFAMLRRVVCCVSALGYTFSAAPITASGPEGGCMGASMIVTIQVIGQDDFGIGG